MAIDEDHIGLAEVSSGVVGLVEGAEAVGIGSLVLPRRGIEGRSRSFDQQDIVVELGPAEIGTVGLLDDPHALFAEEGHLGGEPLDIRQFLDPAGILGSIPQPHRLFSAEIGIHAVGKSRAHGDASATAGGVSVGPAGTGQGVENGADIDLFILQIGP
jgi:hypothetical protein